MVAERDRDARAAGACSRASACRPRPRRASRIARAKRVERRLGLGAGVDDVEPERRRDLVVARAARVDLAADVAEQPLDRRVHVLVGRDRSSTSIAASCSVDLGELGVVEDPGGVRAARRAAACPGCRTGAARRRARAGTPTPRARAGADASDPERHGPSSSGSTSVRREPQLRCAASIRRASAMSLILTASWPMRSAAVNAVALRSMLSRSGL